MTADDDQSVTTDDLAFEIGIAATRLGPIARRDLAAELLGRFNITPKKDTHHG